MVDVAASAGVSVETLRKIETGRSPSPEFFTIVRICAVLEVEIDQLVQAATPAPWTPERSLSSGL